MVKGGIMKYKNSMTTQCKPGGGITIQFIYRKEELFKTSSFIKRGGNKLEFPRDIR